MAALSPDGTTVVYAANRQLYVRRLNDTEARAIPGTHFDVSTPFFSPDGVWIGFWSGQDSALKKVAVEGSAAITLVPASNPRGASWFDDRVVFAEGGKGVMVVPATGGRPELWTAPREDEMLQSPQILPGGDAVLFTAVKVMGNRATSSDVVVYSRATGGRKVVVPHASMARYLATGVIVYAVGGSLFAGPFDSRRLQVTGRPALIAEDLMQNPMQNMPSFDVSPDGTLIYLPDSGGTDSPNRRLVLMNFNGDTQVLGAPPASYETPRVSPDGRRLAVTTDDDGGTIWICEVASPSVPRRLTFQGHARSPLWSPDGRRIVFGSTREGHAGIFVQAADGSGGAERLTASEPGVEHTPGAWSRDGKTIVFMSVKAGIKDTIWTVGVRGDHKDQIVAVAGSNQMDPTLSPDGRWLAFSSEGEAGESIMNVFVQPFPANGAKYQISRNGGDMPVWSPDGQRLFFRKPISRRLVSVRIRSQPSFSVDDAVALGVDGLVTDAGYDLVPGRGFVVPVPVGQRETPGRGSSHRIDVVLNSFEGIQRAVRRERDSIGQ